MRPVRQTLQGIATCLLLFASVQAQPGHAFYVDGLAGNDANDGRQPTHPWKSIAAASAHTFQPGDHLYFRAGQHFAGMLHPLGSGTPAAPITLSSFGTGQPATLTGNSQIATILLENLSFWTVRDLDITNDAPEEGRRNGILIQATRAGQIVRGITIQHVHVSHVRGLTGEDNSAKDTGGIGIFAPELDRPARFNGLVIRDSTIEHVDNIGIWLNTYPALNPTTPAWGVSSNQGIRILNNHITDTGRNAIIIRQSLAPVIEGNTVSHASARHHGNAIFTRSTRDAVIRHNEVSFTGTESSGENAAFDADIDSIHTVIEDNWSHDNQGGLFSLCNNPADDSNVTDDTIVRFNVSENDGIRAFGFSGGVTHSSIYNNTVLIGAGHREALVEARPFSKSKPRYADGATILHNVFILDGEGFYDFGSARNLRFDDNCYIGELPTHPGNETNERVVKRSAFPPSSPAHTWQELEQYKAAAKACAATHRAQQTSKEEAHKDADYGLLHSMELLGHDIACVPGRQQDVLSQ